ncbi:MAG: hypothetical protein D6689_18250 [Deltaproteobacteria bacterium]|nr:MAG: hypothetical protein D6689_18250 [Deltaproteobacteria bacterium]
MDEDRTPRRKAAAARRLAALAAALAAACAADGGAAGDGAGGRGPDAGRGRGGDAAAADGAAGDARPAAADASGGGPSSDAGAACAEFAFSVPPMDLAAIATIIPIGSLGNYKGGVPIPKTYQTLADRSVAAEVRAPADLTLFRLFHHRNPDGSYDAGLLLAACGADIDAPVVVELSHVTAYAPRVAALLADASCDEQPDGAMDCDWQGDVPVAAGEPLGAAGGPTATSANALDFGVTDRRAPPADLIGSPEFWKGLEYARCPYDYFGDEALRAGYDELLARGGAREPRCGTLELGVVGALQGPWFSAEVGVDAARINQTPVVGFYPAVENASREAINAFFGWDASLLAYYEAEHGGRRNRAAAEVVPGPDLYCYDDLKAHPLTDDPLPGHALVRVDSAGQMWFEYVPDGPCPANLDAASLSPAAAAFVR